ncbi:MAG: cytochrome C, partial [Bacteroidia bacterium]
MRLASYIIVFSCICFFTVSCNHPVAHEHGSHSVIDQMISEHNDSLGYEHKGLDIAGVDTVKVETKEGHPKFYIDERTQNLIQFKCSKCHTEPLNKLKSTDSLGGKKSHWNLELNHADAHIMECNTCHNMNEHPDKLRSIQGKSIDYNHSYKQCSQCHSTQYKDWLGGAHGKNLSGWTQPRVSKTCVSCHNPHKPSFEKRWPARLNTI